MISMSNKRQLLQCFNARTKDKITIWDKADMLDSMEAIRDKRRKGHLTFDCFKAHFNDDRVFCIVGHKLAGNGSMFLLSVLKGVTATQCKGCPDKDI